MPTLPETMTAVLPGEVSGARVAHITKLPVPVPVPGSGEVLIKVAAAGVNRGDLAQVAGMYPPPPGAPQTLGLEVSGTIVDGGPNSSRWGVGDEVCALVAGGGYAEYCIAHEGSVLPVIAGSVPALGARGSGCHFASRCALVHARCSVAPPLTGLARGGREQVACWATAGS